jgi:hypothetical protein
MAELAGIPYVEATFDENGAALNPVTVPAGASDVFVISHGWNNDAAAARALYGKFFDSFVAVAGPNDLAARTPAIVGVIWPSKAFDELVAVAAMPGDADGAMSLGVADAESQRAVEDKLERMKEFFTDPAKRQAIDEAKTLIPDLDEKASARRAFVNKIRSLVSPIAVNREDASDTFFRDDGDELMKNLKVDEDDLADDVAAPGGVAAMSFGRPTAELTAEGAAGLKALLHGFKAAAMNVLNFTTYYEMKARAGTVGKNGVAPLIDGLPAHVRRIHLIGHSFGGRVVTAAAANSTTHRIASMTLLQTAFSHNGFSRSMSGFFRAVVDQRRVNGPIVVTHTKNDRAVGVAYPLASRISRDKVAAFGDEHDVFGGLGRNGAQKMEQGEVVVGRLMPQGSTYSFAPGTFFNLEASDFIKGHSDVTGREVAYAVCRAIAGP